jgi:hypothetical protein
MYIKYDHVDDLSSLFQTPSTDATLDEPPDEPPFGSDGITHVTRDHHLYHDWKDECTDYRTRMTAMKSNRIKLFNTILLQCSNNVEQKLEATTGYKSAVVTHDCLWLIRSLKNVCHHFEHTENRFMELYNAKSTLYHLKQNASQSTGEYYKLFQALLSVIESYGSHIHDPATAAPPNANLSSLASDALREAHMRDRGIAAAFLDQYSQRFPTLTDWDATSIPPLSAMPTSCSSTTKTLLAQPRPATPDPNNITGVTMAVAPVVDPSPGAPVTETVWAVVHPPQPPQLKLLSWSVSVLLS